MMDYPVVRPSSADTATSHFSGVSISDHTVEIDLSVLRKPGKRTCLGEIVGAINLNPQPDQPNSASAGRSGSKTRLANAYCNIYWADRHIHQTKTVVNSNDPIWTCESGSLFTFDVPRSIKGNPHNAVLRVEIFHFDVSKRKGYRIGVASIPGKNIIDGKWLNEERMEMEIISDIPGLRDSFDTDTTTFDHFGLSSVYSEKNVKTVAPSFELSPLVNGLNNISTILEENDDDSSTEESVSTLHSMETDTHNYGGMGTDSTLAIRFREATEADIAFLESMKHMLPEWKGSGKRRYNANTTMVGAAKMLDGKSLAQLVTEKGSSYVENMKISNITNTVNFRYRGKMTGKDGVVRLRVKPGPDPTRPFDTTRFLSEAELLKETFSPSTNWVEAGSGSLGLVMVEVLSCQGLKNKDVGRVFGNKTDPFVCLVYEDCLVETDVIQDCLNPMWMPWTQRAFIFNRMSALSSLYIGVFDHDFGPFNHQSCGRVVVDVSEFKPNTEYTLKYNLFSSNLLTDRKSKGSITIRVRIASAGERAALVSMLRPLPMIHVNVRRRKTYKVARYTTHGKYSEDVYNLRILRSYIDEFLEMSEEFLNGLQNSLSNTIFWRGHFKVGPFYLPIHSFVAFTSAQYVVERPNLFPSYCFFIFTWCMLVSNSRRQRNPSPWQRHKSLMYYLSVLLGLGDQSKHKGIHIAAGEGYLESELLKQEWDKRYEEEQNKKSQISKLRRELQKILQVVQDSSIHTIDKTNGINPLTKLLPIQLILRDVLTFLRGAKSIFKWERSQASFFMTVLSFTMGVLLLFIPWPLVFHWICRLSVWLFLGPHMKLVDYYYRKEVDKVMEEIKDRELNLWQNARIRKEEAMKLKATRVARFGKFAVKVPSVNVTRYYNVPLPESTACPVEDLQMDDSTIVSLGVEKIVPGQKHYGVMIPELTQKTYVSAARKLLDGWKDRMDDKEESLSTLEDESISDTRSLLLNDESPNIIEQGQASLQKKDECFQRSHRLKLALDAIEEVGDSNDEGVELISIGNAVSIQKDDETISIILDPSQESDTQAMLLEDRDEQEEDTVVDDNDGNKSRCGHNLIDDILGDGSSATIPFNVSDLTHEDC